jgi:hypothetical protein
LQLFAASSGHRTSPWRYLDLSHSHLVRALLLAGGMIALALVIVLELRRRENLIAVSVAGSGSVVLPSAAVERLLEHAVVAHTEVVAARVQVTTHDGRLAAGIWAALRPGADAEKIETDVRREATDVLGRMGFPLDGPQVRLKVLRVRELRKYL